MIEQSFAQKVDKVKFNIKTHHITCGVSHEFNSESYDICKFHVKQSLKIIILHYSILNNFIIIYFCNKIKLSIIQIFYNKNNIICFIIFL